MTMSDFKPTQFNWVARNGVAVITLKGTERKNPITFESYAELGQTFRELSRARDIKVVVFGSNGGNFCSGGDVHEIIGPLTKMNCEGLLRFTRMTGDLVRAMRCCPQPIIAAVDGVCVGAGVGVTLAEEGSAEVGVSGSGRSCRWLSNNGSSDRAGGRGVLQCPNEAPHG